MEGAVPMKMVRENDKLRIRAEVLPVGEKHWRGIYTVHIFDGDLHRGPFDIEGTTDDIRECFDELMSANGDTHDDRPFRRPVTGVPR